MAVARVVIGRQMFPLDITDVIYYTPETVCYHTRIEQDATIAMFFGPPTECVPAGGDMHGMRVDAGSEACDDAGDDGQAGDPSRTGLDAARARLGRRRRHQQYGCPTGRT